MDTKKILILFFTLGILAGFFKYVVKPIIKGKIGEFYVSTLLKSLPGDKYILLNDVMFPTAKGTTQIDHIVLSIYGIFVIETKNYKGWIYGNDNSDKWTQNIYGHKNQFMNPLKQNYGHISALRKLLDVSEDKFISIIAFSGEATLKVKSSKEVVTIGRVKRTILKYKTPLFTEKKILSMRDKINSSRVESTHENKVEHVKNIKANVKVEKENIRMGKCPKCGGKLVDRNGKYGPFVGCSNYPKCRYIQK